MQKGRPMSRLIRLTIVTLALACGSLSATTASAGNWPQGRGPTGDDVSRETGLPLKWGDAPAAGIAWKAPLPEWGTSTPAIWGDSIFLTTEAGEKLLALCLDKKTGSILWTRQIGTGRAI